jgi:hypothetical protein
MAFPASATTRLPADVTIEVVQRLWRTKLKCIALAEQWLTETSDLEIKAGLKMQLNDERRHLRLLADQLKRLGGRLPGGEWDRMIARPLALIQAQEEESLKLAAYYNGLKAFMAGRCNRLIPLVDAPLARALEQIAGDEDGQVRWAGIRLARVKDLQQRREIDFMLRRMDRVLAAVWARTWLRLTSVSNNAHAPYGRKLA